MLMKGPLGERYRKTETRKNSGDVPLQSSGDVANLSAELWRLMHKDEQAGAAAAAASATTRPQKPVSAGATTRPQKTVKARPARATTGSKNSRKPFAPDAKWNSWKEKLPCDHQFTLLSRLTPKRHNFCATILLESHDPEVLHFSAAMEGAVEVKPLWWWTANADDKMPRVDPVPVSTGDTRLTQCIADIRSRVNSMHTDVVHVGVAYLGCFRVCTVSQFVLQDASDGATELRKDLESDLRTAAASDSTSDTMSALDMLDLQCMLNILPSSAKARPQPAPSVDLGLDRPVIVCSATLFLADTAAPSADVDVNADVTSSAVAASTGNPKRKSKRVSKALQDQQRAKTALARAMSEIRVLNGDDCFDECNINTTASDLRSLDVSPESLWLNHTHHERRAGKDKALSAFPQFKDLLSDGEVKILKRVIIQTVTEIDAGSYHNPIKKILFLCGSM